MKTVAVFVRECLVLLWMVFFRPRSLMREVKQLDQKQVWRLVAQIFIITTVPTVLLLVVTLPSNFVEAFQDTVVFAGAGLLRILVGLWAAIGTANEVKIITFGLVLLFVVCIVATVIGVVLFVYFHPFLLPIEMLTTLWALLRARRNPKQATRFLRQSLAYWDEVMVLRQPFLTRLLVMVGEQDREAGRSAIDHLVRNTPQKHAAVNALIELGNRELLRCQTVKEIVQSSKAWDRHILRHESPLWMSTDPVVPVIVANALKKRRIIEAHQRCFQISTEVATALAATSNYHKLTAFNRARRGLDKLSQFAIIGLRGRESRIFVQIAQQWLEAVNAEIDRLTEEERVAERIPNPYVAPRPLSPDNDDISFVGRADVFRFVEEHFLRASQNVPIVLHGQPRIGKTSILRHFTTHLTTDLIPVYVDMQRAAQVDSTGGLLFNLADTIAQTLVRRGLRLPEPSLGDYANEPFIVFAKFLDAVESAIDAPENRVVLAFDEFEEIERKLVEGKVSKDLMPFLRNMMQHRRGFALLFAGTHTLDEMIRDNWIPYFRSAVPCKVSYLDKADAHKLITNPIDPFPLNYEPEVVEHLLKVTHCHPCLIQLTCSTLVDEKNKQRSHHAAVEDVEGAFDKVLMETGDYVFRGIWEWIPRRERAVLSTLASAGQATVKQLVDSLKIPSEDIEQSLKRLVEAEVVMNADDSFRFQVELLRRWVERTST